MCCEYGAWGPIYKQAHAPQFYIMFAWFLKAPMTDQRKGEKRQNYKNKEMLNTYARLLELGKG